MDKPCFTFTTSDQVEAITKIVRLITEDKVISISSRRISCPQSKQKLHEGTIEYTITVYKE
ncbi:hypothetical protein C3Z10_21995 (plasmid) [Bacillus velezensis]|uniref:Uncharacterized protein n=1 Tax=Bacillus velezensis TaxID=492670 RepID=A0ABC8DFY1_BACVE|nr:hypothetical protein C3Z10_21995 [Bacillus velezensis]AWX74623.1 hypothetical protein BVDSYZ_21505 [Bacillus velezensis]KDN91409.1 hypothetical protein EF87_18770 [Bacillus amyloliquefaciens]UFD97678.1 hypothetical protein [Bacillus amyloliquefaciens]CUB44020.1 hypothetical protein BN2127_JRS8_02736 [Bacillus amyloliquefaciens]